MASKNISITEEVYNKLIRIKREDESFSELFLRLIKSQKNSIGEAFGKWDLTEEEIREIWDPITKRNGRSWNKPSFDD
ncbi:MAG: antitoxin [Candidatus Lokiarchaeota archaeon]|nr:antitoxin [Candidatus Lokiarchaeota archaeon]MBD3202620.1 antitoxin [Candidatus Lokiarchaeota archaeon]